MYNYTLFFVGYTLKIQLKASDRANLIRLFYILKVGTPIAMYKGIGK